MIEWWIPEERFSCMLPEALVLAQHALAESFELERQQAAYSGAPALERFDTLR